MTWRAHSIVLTVLLSYPGAASAQITVSHAANVASLGAIPNSPAGTTCGASRDVTFTVPGQMIVQSVEVLVQLNHVSVGDLQVVLIEPTGFAHALFARVGVPFYPTGLHTPIAGTFGFSDVATGDLWAAAGYAGGAVLAVPPGSYRTSAASTGAATSLTAVFSGKEAAGTWTLRILDCYNALGTGVVTAATTVLTGFPATTASPAPGTVGAIPDGPSATPQTPGAPRDVTFTIPPGGASVGSVSVAMTLSHPFVGDVVARLIAPNGASHVVFGYTGAGGAGATGRGTGASLFGPYTFKDSGTYNWWDMAAAAQGNIIPIVPGGSAYPYRTSQIGGPGSTGALTSMNAAFAGMESSGVWTLRLTDGSGAASSAGSISAASLTLGFRTTPTSVADAYATTFATPLAVGAPGVLGNDLSNQGGAMTAALNSEPAHGIVALAATGAFSYTPTAGFAGTDTFTYRAATLAGAGTLATVTIAVAAPTAVQAPTQLVASSIVGNQVTLRWTPAAAGPAPVDYLVEGGIAPGEVLGAAQVGSAFPILTFTAPSGAFRVRVRALANGLTSGPSNELPIFVNTPTPPSAPTDFTGLVNGTALGLGWRNTFAGGAPTALVLSVSGSGVGTLPMALAETFVFAGVPGGTYTFRLRAVNAAGSSADSSPVTLTFPNTCSGAPLVPERFLAYAIGSVLHLVWDPPASGPATASYVLVVGGAFTGSVPLGVRSVSTPAPPGAYTFNVVAVNDCGAGPATPTQTVFVP